MLAIFSRWIVLTFFREIVLDGAERLPLGQPVIFTPNHPNALLDPLLLFLFSPNFRIRFVAKSTLFKIPFFGWMLRSLGSIPVVRHMDAQGEVDYTAFFAKCLEALAEGDSIVIFPEGRSLPQPFLAPLKTGPARLFFMAKEKGISVRIVPVGLNYERGAIFRSSVLISVAPPIETDSYEQTANSDPKAAVHQLTEEIGQILDRHVFQAETFRDRELTLLLERLYFENKKQEDWPERLVRLKEFEMGFEQLRTSHPGRIQVLRHLLTRYERLSALSGIDVSAHQNATRLPFRMFCAGILGALISLFGAILNWIPYHLVDFLVKAAKKDESDAATYKVVYSIFLFPLCYFLEGWLLKRWLGWGAAAAFAVIIIPLSYFTLLFYEWREETGGKSPHFGFWFGGTSRRISRQLERLRTRIVEQVNELAALRNPAAQEVNRHDAKTPR